jgi:acetolactate synthase-1/3 small subunit
MGRDKYEGLTDEEMIVLFRDGDQDAMEKLLREYEILELVRTGVVALERGQETIKDETKEKGEFDYGKNVL